MRRCLWIAGIVIALGAGPKISACFAQQTPNAPTPQPDKTKPAATTKVPPPGDADQKKHSTAEDNPFPEDVSKQAAEGASSAPSSTEGSGAAPGATEPGSAPAGDVPPASSSSREKLQGMDLLGDTTTRTQDEISQHVLDPKQATEDVRIGELYLAHENPQGAYTRFKEATLLNPNDARAVFDLAEAARKLNRNDEAIENYKVYLDAFPDGPKAKAVRKAISEMAAQTKP